MIGGQDSPEPPGPRPQTEVDVRTTYQEVGPLWDVRRDGGSAAVKGFRVAVARNKGALRRAELEARQGLNCDKHFRDLREQGETTGDYANIVKAEPKGSMAEHVDGAPPVDRG